MLINDMQIIRTEENVTHIWDGEKLIMTLSGIHHSRGTLTDIISAYQQGWEEGRQKAIGEMSNEISRKK